MTGEQVIFGLIALITLGFAIGMVTINSVFHAALLMIGAFGGVAALFVTLNAGFLGVVQVLIYIGAIAVLILFAVMLTPRVMDQEETRRGLTSYRPSGSFATEYLPVEEQRSRFSGQWPLAALMAAGLAGILAVVSMGAGWHVKDDLATNPVDYAVELGRAFMGPYILPFEVASVVLLVALIGAIVIAREE